MTLVSGLVLLLSLAWTRRIRSRSGRWPPRLSTFELGVSHMLVQPARQALAIFVNDVIGQPCHRAVDAARSPTGLPSILRVPAVHSRTTRDPLYQPACRIHVPWNTRRSRCENAALRCPQPLGYLCGKLWRHPLVGVDEIHPVVPDLREPKGEFPLARKPKPGLLHDFGAEGTRERSRCASVEPESTTSTWSAHASEARQRTMFASSSRVSTTTLTGTLPGGGASPGGTVAARAWSLEASEHPVEVGVRDRTAPGRALTRMQRSSVACRSESGRRGVAAQRGAGDLPVLRRVPGDHGLPVDPRLGQRPAERLQARREVDGPAAGPQPAQSARCSSRPTKCSRGLAASEAGTSAGLAVTIRRTDSSSASSTAASHSVIRLGHVLVGREEHRAQDQRAARRAGVPGSADTGCMRTTTRSATSGSTALIRSAIAVQGATSTSDRLAARWTIRDLPATRRAQPGSRAVISAVGEEVQRVAQQGPPLPAWRRNPTLFSATRRLSPRRRCLPGRQPGQG